MLVACVGGLLERSTRGGMIVVGPLNLGGSVELLSNPAAIAETAVDKQAATLLMPMAARHTLDDLPDELWTKLDIELYGEPADGGLQVSSRMSSSTQENVTAHSVR